MRPLRFFSPQNARGYDAFVLYDMPGIEFSPSGVRFHEPPEQYKRDFLELLETGHGFVFLHHAIAGWPTWPEYAEIRADPRFERRLARIRPEYATRWPAMAADGR